VKVDGKTLLLILVPFAFLAGGIAVFLVMSATNGTRAVEDGEEPDRLVRPRWGNPRLWVGVCAGLALLGLVVAPRLFGVAFLLLPFIWMGGFRPRERR
jgi:hypothetical protein